MKQDGAERHIPSIPLVRALQRKEDLLSQRLAVPGSHHLRTVWGPLWRAQLKTLHSKSSRDAVWWRWWGQCLSSPRLPLTEQPGCGTRMEKEVGIPGPFLSLAGRLCLFQLPFCMSLSCSDGKMSPFPKHWQVERNIRPGQATQV